MKPERRCRICRCLTTAADVCSDCRRFDTVPVDELRHPHQYRRASYLRRKEALRQMIAEGLLWAMTREERLSAVLKPEAARAILARIHDDQRKEATTAAA